VFERVSAEVTCVPDDCITYGVTGYPETLFFLIYPGKCDKNMIYQTDNIFLVE
jgi:hypothetical protein